MRQYNYKCVVAKNGSKMYYKRVNKKNSKTKWKRVSNAVGMKAEKGKRKYNFENSHLAVGWYKGSDNYISSIDGPNNAINFFLRCPRPELANIIEDAKKEYPCQWPFSFLVILYTNGIVRHELESTLAKYDNGQINLALDILSTRYPIPPEYSELANFNHETIDDVLDNKSLKSDYWAWIQANWNRVKNDEGLITEIINIDGLINVLGNILRDINDQIDTMFKQLEHERVVWRGSPSDVSNIETIGIDGIYAPSFYVSTSPDLETSKEGSFTDDEEGNKINPFKIILEPGVSVYEFDERRYGEPEILLPNDTVFIIENDPDYDIDYEGQWFQLRVRGGGAGSAIGGGGAGSAMGGESFDTNQFLDFTN